MRRFFKITAHLFWIMLLTLFSQVGGIIWVICLPIFAKINARGMRFIGRTALKTASFLVIYTICAVWIVPPLAKWQCGRVPLPVWSNAHIRPQNAFYFCLLNHHYVRPELKTAAENTAQKLAEKFPGTTLFYLDANFPFWDGYPLEPHFSHRDGKKLDIALHFQETQSGKPVEGSPNVLGYGAFVEPTPGEINMDGSCQGSTFRNLEKDWFGTYDPQKFTLDAARTREMIRLFAEETEVGKILLEPHLKNRLNLNQYDKIRFQGCRAARHDDHIHVQL